MQSSCQEMGTPAQWAQAILSWAAAQMRHPQTFPVDIFGVDYCQLGSVMTHALDAGWLLSASDSWM